MFFINYITILKDKKYTVLENYIRYEHLLFEMIELIKHDIIYFIYDSYYNLIKKLSHSLKQKFNNFIVKNCK